MPPQLAALFEKIRSAVMDMVDSIRVIYGEKGVEPFKKPLMVALPTLFVLYAMVYLPITGNLQRAAREEENMRAVAQHAGDYEDAKKRLTTYQRKLPLIKDKGEWLNYLITSSARNSGVALDSLGAQTENELGNYLVVSREVSATTTYAVVGRWLAEIENSPIFLRITEMNLTRVDGGIVKISFTLSTIFPKTVGKGKGK